MKHQKKYKHETTTFFATFAVILCAFALKVLFFGGGRRRFLTQRRKDFTQGTQRIRVALVTKKLRVFVPSRLRVENKHEVQFVIHSCEKWHDFCSIQLV